MDNLLWFLLGAFIKWVLFPSRTGRVGTKEFLTTGNTSEPPPPPGVETFPVPPEPRRPIKEPALKKGGVAENGLRPPPLRAKPGDVIIVEGLPEEKHV